MKIVFKIKVVKLGFCYNFYYYELIFMMFWKLLGEKDNYLDYLDINIII